MAHSSCCKRARCRRFAKAHQYYGVLEDYDDDDDDIHDIPVVKIADALRHLPAVTISSKYLDHWQEKLYFPAKISETEAVASPRQDYVRVFNADDRAFLGVGQRLDKKPIPPAERPKGGWTNRYARSDDSVWTVRREVHI